MKPPAFLALMLFAAVSTGCERGLVSEPRRADPAKPMASPQPGPHPELRAEFNDLLSPPRLFVERSREFQFKIVHATNASPQDAHSILLLLRAAKAAGKDFDAIRSITFESPTNAVAAFVWSLGFHYGTFTLEKRDSTWTITDEKYFF